MSPDFRPGARAPRVIAVSALAAGLAFGAAAPAFASAPFAPPGDNGTVKIHSPQTPEEDDRNEPKVCEFQVVGHGFDPAQEVTWEILTQGGKPSEREVVLSGGLELDGEGAGSTELLTLDDGHYRLEWTFEGQQSNAAKHKVFKVECSEEEPSPEPSPSPGGEPSTPPESPEPTDPPTVEPTDPAAPVDPTEPETPVDPTEPATPGPSDEPTAPAGEEPSLPLTGSAIAGLVAAGAAAAAGGGAAIYFGRKRRLQ
ncbi:LPXTG cell wall anchor domain-containing protein [Nocardiopsis sp. NPDC057823]|uniref:LPXTG cell wall anchor domain-containing protein n=1 Tax=Nocardiopsis sp. NPDC057823 TaxID=3346256 RepID=UPI003671ECBC